MHNALLDIAGAYKNVDEEALCNISNNAGISDNCTELLKEMHHRNTVCVKRPGIGSNAINAILVAETGMSVVPAAVQNERGENSKKGAT